MRKYSMLISISLLLFGCKNSPTEPTLFIGQGNAIINPSFEIFGKPSLDGWKVEDTAIINFTNDTPPGGGFWSITLSVTWFGPPTRYPTEPYQKFRLINGTHIYTFSFWAKRNRVGGSGYVGALKTDQAFTIVSYKRVTDTTWTLYSIVDTISSSQYDSVIAGLSGGATELAGGKTYFDNCSLSVR